MIIIFLLAVMIFLLKLAVLLRMQLSQCKAGGSNGIWRLRSDSSCNIVTNAQRPRSCFPTTRPYCKKSDQKPQCQFYIADKLKIHSSSDFNRLQQKSDRKTSVEKKKSTQALFTSNK